ncbi:MAG: ABC transporter permease [Bacteroidota bacterium]
MKKHLPISPKFSDRILSWCVKEELFEEISGDLYEYYNELTSKPTWKRSFLYWYHFIHFLQPFAIKKLEGTQKLNLYGMFKNDIKTSLRIIKREKLYSAINILGLAAGFVIAVLILLYVRFEQSYESYNPNSDKVVRITMDYLDGETLIDQDCETYHVLGPMIKEEFPEITDFARAYGLDGMIVTVDGKQFRESNVYAVDPAFLKMLAYPLIYGDNQTALSQTGEVVLTRSSAIRFFGKENVVGEQLSISSNPLKIVGVINDSPANTHLKFGLLLSYTSMKRTLDKRENPWDSNDTFTYLELTNPDAHPSFRENLSRFSDRLREEDYIPDERIISQGIKDIHLHSHKSYEAEQNGSATLVYFLLGVALLVIIIAILNYINLSTAQAINRAKEAGIRRIVGSSKAELRARFFIESVLLNLFAGSLSILIIWAVDDHYKSLAGLPENFQILTDPGSWYLLGTLLLTSTLLSGIFPAFVIGSFKPLNVLKGDLPNSKRGVIMRKALVTIQFSIAIFLLIQTFIAGEQLSFMINKDLGMNTNKIVVINAPVLNDKKQSFEAFSNSVRKRASFLNVGLSSTVPGLSTASMSSTTNIGLDEEPRDLKNNFFMYLIDSNFFSTMEMEMIEGKDFPEISNFEYPIVVNEEALRIWGIADPKEVINKKSTFWGRNHTVIGVVKDFHQLGAKSAYLPMIFILWSGEPDYISVRLSEGEVLDQISELEEVYREHFSTSPFDFFFLDQNFDAQYRADRQFQQIFSVLSGFAILITCLGLFGLSSFTVAKRTKEIGIRKVLGASISQIVNLLSKDFITLVAISSVVAIPLSYLIVENWLNQYSFRISINLWLFMLPTLLVLFIAFMTVFSKAYQASHINPAESLRDE